MLRMQMKKLIPFIMLALAAPMTAAKADITHKLSSSVQLRVDAAATQVERIGSSFSITGNGVDTTDGNTASTVSVGTITSGVYAPGTIAAAQDVPGAAFSFTQSYTQADAVSTAAPTVGTVGNFSNQTSTSAGTAGTLAGTITSAGVMTITAGGAGTTATGQSITELNIF